MTNYQIEQFDELMRGYVGPNKKIIDRKFSSLTAPGENYFSLMLQVDVKTKNESSGEEEDIHAVAKCVTVGDVPDFLLLLTFVNELAFYNEIIPTLKEFQREMGVPETDIFPEVYAVRYNFHGKGTEVDKHSVIVLENLESKGFSNADRHIGFNLEEAKVILKSIAEFNAIPFALKLKKPYVFEQRIKKNIKKPGPPGGPGGPGGSPPEDFSPPGGPGGPGVFQPPGGPGGPPLEFGGPEEGPPDNPEKVRVWVEVLSEYKECKPYLKILQKKADEKKLEPFSKYEKETPFSTLIHQDMWVNNTMQSYKNGRIHHNKIVDFQMYGYDSPVKDLLFFLFSSVQIPVLKTHLDELIKHYHTHFVEVLESLKCDTTPYNYYKFLVEVDSQALSQLAHMLMMSLIIFGKKNESVKMRKLKKENITKESKERLAYIVEEFGKRRWLS